jgi:hypothetical protein
MGFNWAFKGLNERKMGSHVLRHIASLKVTGDFHHITGREGPEGE